MGSAEITFANKCNMVNNITPTRNQQGRRGGPSNSGVSLQMNQPAFFQQMAHPTPVFTPEQY